MSLTLDIQPLIENFPLRIYSKQSGVDRFADFCRHNPDLRIEQDAQGTLVIMAPTFTNTGMFSGRLFRQLDEYCEATGNGYAFDSSTGFTLPNGARRSPDAAWVPSETWDALTVEQQESYSQICPAFAIELMSKSDILSETIDKMNEYLTNGTSLGLLIDRANRRVYVYRPHSEVEILENPTEISAEPVTAGFSLKMARIFG